MKRMKHSPAAQHDVCHPQRSPANKQKKIESRKLVPESAYKVSEGIILRKGAGIIKMANLPQSMEIKMADLFQSMEVLYDYYLHSWIRVDSGGAVSRHLKPAFGSLRPDQMTPALIKDYIHARRRQGAAASTINRELKLFKRALSLGTGLTEGRVASLLKIQHLREDRGR